MKTGDLMLGLVLNILCSTISRLVQHFFGDSISNHLSHINNVKHFIKLILLYIYCNVLIFLPIVSYFVCEEDSINFTIKYIINIISMTIFNL